MDNIMDKPIEIARKVYRTLDRIRERLLAPSYQALADCDWELGQAVEDLARLQKMVESSKEARPAELDQQLRDLRRLVAQVTALVANAGDCYLACARMLSANSERAQDYNGPRGVIGSPAPPQLVVHG
jgi:hypothetical protein